MNQDNPAYPPPLQGYSQPGQYYPPPVQGYPPPAQGYPPPAQGFLQRDQGFSQQGPESTQPVMYYQPKSQVKTDPYSDKIIVVPEQQRQGNLPTNWIIPAILVTVFCAWPLGLIAIMTNHSARQAATRGDFQLAESKAKTTRNLIIAAVLVGLAFWGYVAYWYSGVLRVW